MCNIQRENIMKRPIYGSMKSILLAMMQAVLNVWKSYHLMLDLF